MKEVLRIMRTDPIAQVWIALNLLIIIISLALGIIYA